MNIQYIHINSIVLDERNPRIAHTTESLAGKANQDFIQLALGHGAPEDEERGASTTYSSLKASIRANKGLISPIIVSQQAGDCYLVIEGNTRVAIYRELANEGIAGPWDSIPAIVKAEIEEAGEHAIRLQAHLVGPRPWRPYAKAKYLHGLYASKKLSVSEIWDFCGGTARRREIEEYIKAYEDMQEYYMPLVVGAPPDYSRFSAFAELQKPQVKQSIVAAGFSLGDFAKWVHEERLHPLWHVRHLARILTNPEAKRQFLAHNSREALKVIEQPSSNTVIKNASIEQLSVALSAKLRSLSWQEASALIEDKDGLASRALVDCFDEMRVLVKQMGYQMDG